MVEYIDREKLMEKFCWHCEATACGDDECFYKRTMYSIPTADVQLVKWIPFSARDLDEEEKENHPDWDCILDGELPEDGQRILVNVKFRGHESVQMDEFYSDCDGSYLDSGYEIGTEVTHWMPLPEPPKEGET